MPVNPTQLKYLEDFDIVSCHAVVTTIETAEDGHIDVQLDQTCFYPRGGGQDWDQGHIQKDSSATFAVEEVRLDENGIVHHLGYFQAGTLHLKDHVTCLVDKERRLINTRLHSAGHVIDMAIDSLGLEWIPMKGQHYPHLSAIEYSGSAEPEKLESLRLAIEQKANTLIASNISNSIRFMPVEAMYSVCRHVPETIPTNKPARVVMYGDNFGIPCGGTHVKKLQEIGSIHIPKLKQKQGIIRVSYTVEGIN